MRRRMHDYKMNFPNPRISTSTLGCIVLAVIFIGFLSSCQTAQMTSSSCQFLPPAGKTLLMIGQDKETIAQYVAATGMIPAGVMVYTSIMDVSGLMQPFDNGSGVQYGAYLAKKYPHSSLQVGLYMVDALEAVNQGIYDGNIDKLAHWIQAQKRPVYLRIGYEFDNAGNHYDPEQYILAFKRIVDRFRELGVGNVAFVWHSVANLSGDAQVMKWFPGSDYVDWLAVSLFAPSQYEQIKRFSDRAKLLNKPFMIAESAPMSVVTLKAKKEWYDKFFRIIAMLKPQAVCYINSDWDSMPMWKDCKFGDSRIQQFPEIIEMWLKEMKKGQYIHAS
ncbi:MAG: hypothetical protein H6753_02925 [Candidatus Omnitrophica bacterium]|nr:hypothetical protein [Candidatus Omnitrophota bacterium]